MSVLLYHQSTVLSHVYYFIICIIESLSEGKSDSELQGTSPMDIHIFCKFIAQMLRDYSIKITIKVIQ